MYFFFSQLLGNKYNSQIRTVRACKASFSCGDWILWERRRMATCGLKAKNVLLIQCQNILVDCEQKNLQQHLKVYSSQNFHTLLE